MDRQQLRYLQKENCFPWIEQVPQAQRLLDEQLQHDWSRELDRILRQNHPLAEEICAPLKLRYYWTTKESEYATDVMFASPKPWRRIYPTLVRHSITSFASGDVMRFLGHRVCANGDVRGEFKGELLSDYKKRPEGIRVKHRLTCPPGRNDRAVCHQPRRSSAPAPAHVVKDAIGFQLSLQLLHVIPETTTAYEPSLLRRLLSATAIEFVLSHSRP